MTATSIRFSLALLCLGFCLCVLLPYVVHAHGTVISPTSRVYRVYLANPDNPDFPLAAQAVAIDGTLSYYTWNELSRNIADAVLAGLPPGFDYSPWVPDGQLASGGRVDPDSGEYPRTYAGLDQVSEDWPTDPVTAGETIEVDFLATAPHDPSVWDVWMTTPDWDPTMPLNWDQMEFLGRPAPVLVSGHYRFDLQIPTDRAGHHVLWVAWQRDDPVGEVFFSTSDLMVEPATSSSGDPAHRLDTGIANYPEPFVGETTVQFSVAAEGLASIRIYDIKGRLVRTLVDSHVEAGVHTRVWDGMDNDGRIVASGVYLARFEHAGGASRRRMVLLK